jgi:hypothetical protein
MKEVAREKREKRNDRYAANKHTRLTREQRESRLIGRAVKEVKRVSSRALETVAEKINPSPDPWEDDDWMVM